MYWILDVLPYFATLQKTKHIGKPVKQFYNHNITIVFL